MGNGQTFRVWVWARTPRGDFLRPRLDSVGDDPPSVPALRCRITQRSETTNGSAPRCGVRIGLVIAATDSPTLSEGPELRRP